MLFARATAGQVPIYSTSAYAQSRIQLSAVQDHDGILTIRGQRSSEIAAVLISALDVGLRLVERYGETSERLPRRPVTP